MRTEIPLLQNVRVASPCPASWEAMESVDGDRVRFCDECRKRVYNLSAMSQAEAEGLLRRHEGHLCVRYYRRQDGTVLTTDCPVGLRAARQMVLTRAKASALLCALLCTAFAAWRTTQSAAVSEPTAGVPSFHAVEEVRQSPTLGTPIPDPPPSHTKAPVLGKLVRTPHAEDATSEIEVDRGVNVKWKTAPTQSSREHHETADAQKFK